MRYHNTAIGARRLDHPTFPTNSRKTFARAAVYEAFRPQDAKAINHGGFMDRQPQEVPRHISEIATNVAKDVDQRVLNHWLTEAARLDGQEREAALEVAREITTMLGIS